MKILLLNVSFFLIACSSSEKHPRQGVRYAVVCKYLVQQCYYKAQDRCEGRSYTLLHTTEVMRTGGPEGRYREFTAHIQCK
jgi:hypothetical protein